MNEKNKFNNIQIALYAIGNPEFLKSKKFQEWILLEDNKALFDELCMKMMGNIEVLSEKQVDDEWRKLRRVIIKNKTRIIMLYVSAAAAVIALVVAVSGVRWEKEAQLDFVPEYIALSTPQEITLQLDNNPPVIIKQTKEAVTCADSVMIMKDLSKQLFHDHQFKNISVEQTHQLILSVPRGKTYYLKLSDGTEVWLNAESKLKYPVPFAKNERLVQLEGEAYFKVSKDKDRPFAVRTPYITTRVLGTEFNVRAYRNDANVTLVKGLVTVNDNNYIVSLQPGQNARAGEEGFTVTTPDIKVYTAWVNGYFYFDEVSLGTIMKELGRWYNIDIEFADSKLAAYKFKYWAYKKDSFKDAIDIINNIGKVSVIIKGDKAVIQEKEKNRIELVPQSY